MSSGRQKRPWLTLGIGSYGLPFEQTTARASHNRTGAETACASEQVNGFHACPTSSTDQAASVHLTRGARPRRR